MFCSCCWSAFSPPQSQLRRIHHPKDLVAQLYRAHGSKHDPLDDTALLSHYFDPALLNLYLKDRREAKGEVGRLDGDPLYNAQEIEIKDFSISTPEITKREARVTVTFKNLGADATRICAQSDPERLEDQRYSIRRWLVAEEDPARQAITQRGSGAVAAWHQRG